MSSKTKTPNFTEFEKSTLIEIMESRKEIIECKQNDGRNVAKKTEEWNRLSDEFNSNHNVNKRTVCQLKALWKNLKARAKAAVAKDRRQKKKTGGGPEEKSLDKFSVSISEMLPQQIQSLQNPFDDDASLHGDEERVTDEIYDNPSASSSPVAGPSLIPQVESSAINIEQPLSNGKRKLPQGRQDQVKSRLLEMAEIEHEKNMLILQLKQDVLTLKKRKLERELGVESNESNDARAAECQQDNESRVSRPLWQPF